MEKRNLIIILMAMSLVLILVLGGCKKTGKAFVACPADMPYCPDGCQRDPNVDCTGQAPRIPPDCKPDCSNQEHPRVDPVPWPDPPEYIYNGEYPICFLMVKRCPDGSYARICNRETCEFCPCPRQEPQPPPPRKLPYPWPYPEIGIIWLNDRPEGAISGITGAQTYSDEERSGKLICVSEKPNPDATASPLVSPEMVYKENEGPLCVMPSPSPSP